MAPKQPSRRNSPRKLPSANASRSGPNSSKVQKRPASNIILKPLNLEQTRYLRESDRSNIAAVRHTQTGNGGEFAGPSDGDEHTSLQVDLSILGTELDEIVNASHAELQNRIRSGENSPNLTQLSQHLLDSPPSSPGSLHSDGSSPKSPTAKARQAQFQKQKLDELIRQDAEFHRLMNDLVGIRQWWKGNKQAWHEKREEVRAIENNITALKAQAEQNRQRGWSDKVMLAMRMGSSEDFFNDRWTPQIEALTIQRARVLPWFDQNRQLMKMVWTRVKELETAVKAEAKAEKLPDKFFGYPPTDDITKLSWYRDLDKGLMWWLKRAMKNLGTLDGYLHGLLESTNNRSAQRVQAGHNFKRDLRAIQDQITKDDTEADDQISDLQRTQPQEYEAKIAQVLNDRYNAKLQQRREEIDLEEMVKEVQKRDKESMVITRSLTDHITRNKEFHALLKRISGNLPKILPQYRISFYTDLYNMICTHVARTRRGLDLSITLDKIDFSQRKREKIITLADNYYQRLKTDMYFRYLEGKLEPKQARTDHKALQKPRHSFEEEATTFTAMIDECTRIFNEQESSIPKIIDPAHPATYLVPSIRNITLTKQPPSTPLDMSRTIGSTMTLAVAKSILEQYPETTSGQITDVALPWYELLRHTYTSPDLFPLFRNNALTKRSWSKDDFVTYTNSFLALPLERSVIEAFLVFCSHTRDLFHITEFRRRVETISSGWELVAENPVSGLKRKVDPEALPRPQGIERAEHVLQHYRTVLGCNEVDRRWNERDLREFLNRVLPGDRKVSRGAIREFVSYWSSVGRFYVLDYPLEATPATTTPNLTRIDAGFAIPPSTPYLPIPFRPSYFKTIRDAIVGKDLRPLMEEYGTVNERRLYRYIFLRGERKGMNWEVTRVMFHCFLRWCDREKYMFSLGRRGEVGVWVPREGGEG